MGEQLWLRMDQHGLRLRLSPSRRRFLSDPRANRNEKPVPGANEIGVTGYAYHETTALTFLREGGGGVKFSHERAGSPCFMFLHKEDNVMGPGALGLLEGLSRVLIST